MRARVLATLAKVLTLGILVAILSLLVALEPNPEGRGTNPQLFGPCPVGTEGAIRCPGCGLTSGLSALIRGRVIEGARRNLLTPLVAVLMAIAGYFALGSLITGTPVMELPGGLALIQRAAWVPVLAAVLYALMQVFDL